MNFSRIQTYLIFLLTATAVLDTFVSAQEQKPSVPSVQAPRDTIPSPSPMQGVPNRRKRALLLRRETAPSARDTSLAARRDTIVVPRDSTARIEQMVFQRKDGINAAEMMKPPHPLYLPGPSQAKTQAQLDTATWMYTVRYTLGTEDLRAPVILPFEEYTNLRLDYAIRQNWAQMVQAQSVQLGKKAGLSELFGQITNIEIPVPKNPIFSIFGPNKIRLQINGKVDIHAAFRNTENDQFVASPLGQSRNEPDFNQEVQINLRGEIGDKLKISADWNTQRTFEYENQLKVAYKGYDDEMVQSIEAGNVSLPTSSAFIPPSQALFGILAKFQFGPLRLTTVASQKKGQIKELSVSGGARPTPFERRPYDYSKDHYFIDTMYIPYYERIFFDIPARPNDFLKIQEMEVWVTSKESFSQTARQVVAFMNLDSVLIKQGDVEARTAEYERVEGEIELGKFAQLVENVDYTYNAYAGIVTINRSLQLDEVVAVAFTIQGTGSPGVTFGNFGTRDTSTSIPLIMKLVRPSNLKASQEAAWRMQLKNRYPLGGRNIKKEGFDFKIEYALDAGAPVQTVLNNINLLRLFGFDRFKEDGVGGEDNTFDYLPGITIDESRGEIIFPTLEPFRAASIEKLLLAQGLSADNAKSAADSFSYEAIYDTSYVVASQNIKNRFSFVGNVTPSTASSYNLGFNIVEGSVEVIVDNQKAAPNVDYTVDYISGTVVIRNQSLLVPGKNLQIRYEANDLFQLASKSLLGARGDLAISKDANLGFTIMNLNQQSLSDKVRLGEEPISNSIMGFDGGFATELPGLTRAMNVLPGVKTLAASSFSVKGEAAFMLPDPNTRKSTIPQDEGKGIAYVDDFEGARRIIPLGIAASGWKDIAPPFLVLGLDPLIPGNDSVFSTSDPTVLTNILHDSTKIQHKAKMSWFNVPLSDVFVQDIWGNRRSVSRQDEQVTVMNLLYLPGERGPYNYSLRLEETVRSEPQKSWAGIQRLLGTTSTNMIDENISFVEMWVKIVEAPPDARLHINLGYVSEDVIPDRDLSTEDGLDGGVINNVLNVEREDVGIDRVRDDDERNRLASFVGKYGEYQPDPSGDNWKRPPDRLGSALTVPVAKQFIGYEGVEGSSASVDGRTTPDTEDLNGNNNLDRVNSYFEYDLSLDTNALGFQKYVVGGGLNGWYQVRIPLNGYERQIGSPSFATIEGVRLWMTGASSDVLVRITEFNLVGNQWEELKKNDPFFRVSTVNYEDNPFYEIPPGVRREKDRTRPDENIFGNEQSLNLIMTDLADDSTRQAIKRFSTRPLDLFNYRAMKMFVHGDNSPGRGVVFNDSSDYDLEMFVRFGTDTLNYYEYRVPVRQGWDPLNDVTIKFSDLTAIKLNRDSARGFTNRFPVEGGPPLATYQIRGEPTLSRIQFISIGVYNPPFKGKASITGELWANELRLTDVDDSPGWAYRYDTQIRFADVASVQFSYTNRDPFFHGLEDRFGSRLERADWTLSASIGLEKFLPDSWKGTTIGVTYSHVENLQRPRYLPGTDVLVSEAAAQIDRDTSTSRVRTVKTGNELRTTTEDLSITETYALPSLKLQVPVDSWLVTETINRLSFGFSYTRNSRRSPALIFAKSWSWNARLGYVLPFSPQAYVEPVKPLGDFFLLSPWKSAKFYYLPRQISLNTTFTRSQQRSHARSQAAESPVNRNFGATRSMAFNWQLVENGLLSPAVDYQVDVTSNLAHLELDAFGQQRSFAAILSSMVLGDRLFDFGNDLQYGQSVTMSTRPVMPKLLDLDKIFTPTFRYNVRYGWNRNIQAGDLGRSANWSSTVSGGFDVNVKLVGEKIWPGTSPAAQPQDSTPVTRSPLAALGDVTRLLIKTPFFDFDRLNVTFTQQNRSQNGGVLGRPGFANVFGRVPFFQPSLAENGPSLLYQLGLSSDPHGRVELGTKGSFPFITGRTIPGVRAARLSGADVYSQSNKVSMRTSRKLWEGAQLDLTWNLGWSFASSNNIQTDSLGGIPRIISRSVSGDIDRSFITLPPVLVFKMFKTSIEDVNKAFERLRADRRDLRTDDAKIAQAFEEGLEAAPIFNKLFGGLMPRLNWSIRWDGLEKLPLFSSFASRVALDHSYTSNFRRRWRLNPQGVEVTEGESVSYGFAPLAGLNITFKGFTGGSLSSQIRYSTNTSFDLSPSVKTIGESNSEEISLTANFSKQGFEFPLFGLSLSNDLQVSLAYSMAKNGRKLYNLSENFNPEGQTLDGSTRTTIEPRIRYILSARVTASLYYRYVKTQPDAGGSKIIGTTVNEGGLDISVAIQ